MADVHLLASPDVVFAAAALETLAADHAATCGWTFGGSTSAVVDEPEQLMRDAQELLEAIACEGGIVMRTDGSILAGELSPDATRRVDELSSDLRARIRIE